MPGGHGGLLCACSLLPIFSFRTPLVTPPLPPHPFTQRADLRRTAYEYATTLMRPEYRASIAEAYKRKIENIVRKKEDEAALDADAGVSACPFCRTEGPMFDLSCGACKSLIPYCCASGRRMTLGEWCQCPTCKFPAIMGELRRVVEADGACPM